LVAVTPAAGLVGPMGAIVLGFIAGIACLWGVIGLKKSLGYDETLDVFGIHGIGGIVGAIGTGIFVDASLGGVGIDHSIATQVFIQTKGVLIAIAWSGVVSFVLFKLIDMTMGLRVKEEEEREGLDTVSHGERAYTNN
jgi:Amt family ammonium transporter